MHRLMKIANDAGLKVIVTTIAPGINGFIDLVERVIYLSRRLTTVELLCTLAHELGHYFHGDRCSDPRAEDLANDYACRILITPDAYAAAEASSPYPHDIAEELGVTVEMVISYQRFALRRIGDRTYARESPLERTGPRRVA